VSFVTDIIDMGVCPGFSINKKNGKVRFPGLQSQNALGFHEGTVSNDFSK